MNSNITVKQVDYQYIQQNLERITVITTEAFLKNHKITKDAFDRTSEKHRQTFVDLFNLQTKDMMEQIHKHGGLFFVAEENKKIIGVSLGRPYGKSALSEECLRSVVKSECCLKEVMQGWWNLMQKFEGTPPGKIYHQAFMVVDPAYAGKGVGAMISALTAKRIVELGFDGYAVETSSESADALAEKMKKTFNVIDVDSNGAGLTFRLHLQPNEQAKKIHQWFLDKKEVKVHAIEINVKEISPCGEHYHVGDIAVWDSNRNSTLPVLVMLHPNSTSRLFFKKQMEDQNLTSHFRLVALDFPGHGDSKPSDTPEKTYTFPGYADSVAKTLKEMGVKKCALLGWSLGGHGAIEALDNLEGLCGIILTGTPPVEVSTAGFMRAFKEVPSDMAKLMGKRHFTNEEAAAFAHVIGKEDWMVKYCLKTDGRARECLLQWISEGKGADQRKMVANTQLPVAYVAGDLDPASPKEYLQSLKFGNLWGMHFIENSGHNVVYEKPEIYNAILLKFLKDIFK